MEPFKNKISPHIIRTLSKRFSEAQSDFKAKPFEKLALANLDQLELKQRVKQVADALWNSQGQPFPVLADWILSILPPALEEDTFDDNMWMVWPLNQVVEDRGLEHFAVAMSTMHTLTQRGSCEFAIRPYLLAHEEKTLKQLKLWTRDKSFHVRRLVSEGSRPRLPWGMRLHPFIKNPHPGLDLIDRLKDDPSLYVRRSVANHLNDVSKDHPDLAVTVAKDWQKKSSPERLWVVKHALRGLIKQGHPAAMTLLNLRPAAHPELQQFSISHKKLRVGEALTLSISLHNPHKETCRLALDYLVHHQKKNGTLSPKVFKWKVLEMAPGETLHLKKSHAMREVTTRVYHPGEHQISLLLGGEKSSALSFHLLP